MAAGWTMMPRGEDRPKVRVGTADVSHASLQTLTTKEGVVFKIAVQCRHLHVITLGNMFITTTVASDAHSISRCE